MLNTNIGRMNLLLMGTNPIGGVKNNVVKLNIVTIIMIVTNGSLYENMSLCTYNRVDVNSPHPSQCYVLYTTRSAAVQ